MKKILALLILTAAIVHAGTARFHTTTNLGAGITFDKGFNFRATDTYVTDGANETYVLDTDIYPVTRNGVTFGWRYGVGVGTLETRDRDSGLDRRLAGVHQLGNQINTFVFQVDLPATGNYAVHLAVGDGGGNAQHNYIVVGDSNTAKITFDPADSDATPTWFDATETEYTAANWVTSETGSTQSFATTQLWVTLAGTVDTDNTVIAHLRIVKQ